MGLGLGLLLIGGCKGQKLTPTEDPGAAPSLPPVLTEVRLAPLRVEDPFRWDAEFRGLATMALEMGLSDLPGVVPRLPGDLAAPSTLLHGGVARRQVDARFVARGEAEALELELELCVAGGGCETHVSRGVHRERPWEGLANLLEGAAVTLGVTVEPAVSAAWRTPGSKDTYAELIAGRACATYYGILPPPEVPGDRRADPVVRAVLIDPRQPLAQWTLARWEAASTADGGLAIAALTRAALVRPSSPVLAADLATLYERTDRPDQAVLAWEELAEGHPGDPRYLEPYARALLAVGRARLALETLDRLPAEFAWDPGVAALRVEVVEAVDGTGELDPLLARWQQTDSRAVEPVRRRVDLRVQAGRYAEALDLVGALRTRAPGPETDALEAALLVAVGRAGDAVALAPPEVASRLRARVAREADLGTIPSLPAEDLEARLARADAALWRNAPAEARAEAEAAIEAAPWRAEGHVLLARALEALGQGDAASDAWRRAWEVDPALEGGPVGAGRIASTFQYVVLAPSAPSPEERRGSRPPGPEL